MASQHDSDQWIVLERVLETEHIAGRIIEQGSHEALVARGRMYATRSKSFCYRLQATGYQLVITKGP